MENDFLTLLVNIQDLTPESMFRFFLLAFFRLAPIVAMTPFLGAKIIPNSARIGLALSLSLLFLPNIIFFAKTKSVDAQLFYVYALKEVMIGFVLALFVSVPFFVVQSSGIIIDYMRGSSMMMAQDPSLQNQASPIGILFNYYLIALYFQLDGPLLFFNALETSFEVFPVNTFSPAQFFTNAPFWGASVDLLNKIFAMSIQLAMPAILGVLMAEVFLGIANRLAPQVQIAFLGMSLKSLLGLLLLWAGWYILIRNMSSFSIDWTKWIIQTVSGFAK